LDKKLLAVARQLVEAFSDRSPSGSRVVLKRCVKIMVLVAPMLWNEGQRDGKDGSGEVEALDKDVQWSRPKTLWYKGPPPPTTTRRWRRFGLAGPTTDGLCPSCRRCIMVVRWEGRR
jgi:hypothetical protein